MWLLKNRIYPIKDFMKNSVYKRFHFFLKVLVIRIKFTSAEGPSVYLYGGSQEDFHDNST